MKISFTLHRNDLWIPIRKINKIYSIAKLTKFFGKDISSQFLPMIKKALLCSNFEYRYSNYTLLFSIILNFIFFNIVFHNYSINNSKDEMQLYITHYFIMNIPNIFSIVSFVSIFIVNNLQIQKEMRHYLKYFITSSPQIQAIRDCKSKENGNGSYSIQFEANFDLVITKTLHKRQAKDRANNRKDSMNKEVIVPYYDYSIKDNQYFEYVINIPNKAFRTFHYGALLQPKENEIIKDIMVYLHNKDVKSKKERLYFSVTILIWFILLYCQRELVTLVISFIYCALIISLYYMFQWKHYAINRTQLNNYLNDLNEEIINCGYYLSVSEYLISLFAIKRTCYYNIEHAQREAELIKIW